MKRDPRRAQELFDSRLIQEDHSAMANLSPIPIHHEWPKNELNAMILFDEVVKRTKTGEDYHHYTGSI
jgi:hypothetical protein